MKQWRRVLMITGVLLELGATMPVLRADEIEPVPLPPAPPSPTPVEETPSGEPTALDRYQDCFQQMIDSGADDNSFMRKCLGIEDPRPREGANAPTFTKDDVVAVFDANAKPLEACYNQLLERSQALHLIPTGMVIPVLTIGGKGAVKKISFEPTQFVDVGLLECLSKKMEGFRFTKAPDQTVIKAPLNCNVASTKRIGRVSLVRNNIRIAGPAFELSSKDIIAVFQKYSPRVRACYDDLVKRNPKAGGTLAVNLLVSTMGRVKKVHFRENTIKDRKFKSCVVTQLKSFRFPKPAGDEDITVKYPSFIFSPKKQP